MKENPIPENALAWCTQALHAAGLTLSAAAPLRVEASHRSFYRLHTGQNSLILMHSPPALERNEQFLTLARLFAGHGLPVPQVLAVDEPLGLFLLTDLGDVHLEDVYGTAQQDQALLAAVDALPLLGATSDDAIEPYTDERLFMELGIFREWFVEGLLAQPMTPGWFEDISNLLVSSANMQPKSCVHRDYHCRNLLFQHGQLGIVDFQDALHGPILYDIASLLRDCYFEFPETEVARWLNHFVAITPQLSGHTAQQIKTWFDWIAIQRQLKAVGIFARLHLRDGKSSHLAHIVPVMQRLETLTRQYPQLQPLNMQLISCIKQARPRMGTLL